MMLGKLDNCMQINKTDPILIFTNINNLNLKYKIWHLEENMGHIFDIDVVIFWMWYQKHKQEKKNQMRLHLWTKNLVIVKK